MCTAETLRHAPFRCNSARNALLRPTDREDRSARAFDRAFHPDRQADHRWRLALHAAKWRYLVAGKKIELIVRDDTGNADTTKRLAQELVVNDKVAILAGFGLTPGAGDGAHLHPRPRRKFCICDDGAFPPPSSPERSPYIVRTSSRCRRRRFRLPIGRRRMGSRPSSRWTTPGIHVQIQAPLRGCRGKVIDVPARAVVLRRFRRAHHVALMQNPVWWALARSSSANSSRSQQIGHEIHRRGQLDRR